MTNRFDVLISRIESQARGLPALYPVGGANGTDTDRRPAKSERERRSLAEKNRAEQRRKHHA